MKSKAKVRFKGLCKMLVALTVFLPTPAVLTTMLTDGAKELVTGIERVR